MNLTFRNSGVFYEAYDDDAIIVHYLFGYKISGARKIGFPLTAKNKVMNVLDSKKINYVFLEPEGANISEDFKKQNTYEKILKKAIKLIDREEIINVIKRKINTLEDKKLDELCNVIKEFLNEK